MKSLLTNLLLVACLGILLSGCASQESNLQDEMANDFELEKLETTQVAAPSGEVPSEPLPTIAPKKSKPSKKFAKRKASKKRKTSFSKKAKTKKPYSAYY